MRWKRLGRRVKARVKATLLERDVKPSPHRWVLIRDRDGRAWAGPYRWQGQTFTESERFWYLFNNIDSAIAAIDGHGFVGVTVQQIA